MRIKGLEEKLQALIPPAHELLHVTRQGRMEKFASWQPFAGTMLLLAQRNHDPYASILKAASQYCRSLSIEQSISDPDNISPAVFDWQAWVVCWPLQNAAND